MKKRHLQSLSCKKKGLNLQVLDTAAASFIRQSKHGSIQKNHHSLRLKKKIK